jgi:hypothetical protein
MQCNSPIDAPPHISLCLELVGKEDGRISALHAGMRAHRARSCRPEKAAISRLHACQRHAQAPRTFPSAPALSHAHGMYTACTSQRAVSQHPPIHAAPAPTWPRRS